MKVVGCSENPVDNIEKVLSVMPRFCYRSGFHPLENTKIQSDKGWGCCYRSSQGIIAQYIIRLKQNNEELFKTIFPNCDDPLTLFYDEPSAPFGIHSLVSATARVGVAVGEWAKPSTIAAGIKIIFESLGLSCYVSQDFAFNIDNIRSDTKYPCLILIPGLFGLDNFDSRFLPFLQLCLCTESSLGFVSGRRNSAFYFFGMNATDFFYFDPHVTKTHASNNTSRQSFFDLAPKSMSVNAINPSILLGFTSSNYSELEDLFMILVSCLASPITVHDNAQLEEMEKNVFDIDAIEQEEL